jgi:hypothetical protein
MWGFSQPKGYPNFLLKQMAQFNVTKLMMIPDNHHRFFTWQQKLVCPDYLNALA